MNQGVPSEYRGARNTLAQDQQTIVEGHAHYAENCASCHGPKSVGDGDAGRALSPSPALLASMIQMPMSVDEYLLWTISEGGSLLDTPMPSFKDQLTRDDIWKIVIYMRAGFPIARKEE